VTAPGPRRRGLIIPAVVTLAVLALLVALGTWQLERKTWKEALIARLADRVAAPSGDLPSRSSWDQLAPEDWEFRRVSFEAELRPDQEALIYTVGSPLRTDISGPGYWVFAPARLRDGSLIVVNRGFVPEGRQDVNTRRDGQVSGTLPIVGVLRWPEARGLFTPADNSDRNLWFVRNHRAIAAAKQWGTVAPFFIDQEAPVPPGGLPKPGKVTPGLPNNHLQYALTWYGLALVLIVMFALWWRSRPTPRASGRD
jgi:surfeit locus 1 family protein